MRSPLLTVMAIGLTAGAGLGLTACDTGDGKQLQPVDPNATSTSTIASADASVGSGPIETGPLPSLPLDGPPQNTLVDPPTGEASFVLFTPWVDGSQIDQRYTCDGDDLSPSLSWDPPPDGTVQLAFSMVDESTFIEGQPFVHWVLAGVDPGEISLLEGQVPVGVVQATNSLGVVGWSGPCPPEGEPAHVYRFTMYALNQQVELADGTPANEFLDYIQQLAIASTEVTATYQR